MTPEDLIRDAFYEDLPHGDLTTDSLGVSSQYGRARLVAKEDLVLSGSSMFDLAMQFVASDAQIKWHFKNGDFVLKNQTLATVKADLIQIIKAERVALNFLGHLSGIATLTRCFVNRINGTQTRILDTRKTLPGYRELQKKAVVDGGGHNHRMNLSEAILVKENHIRIAGGITQAVNQIRKKSSAKIEVEVTTLAEVSEAIDLKVDRLLLDNMNNELIKEVLAILPSSIATEASGNMNLERVKSVAELGVDYISVGALTHSAPTADVSLLFEWPDEVLHGKPR